MLPHGDHTMLDIWNSGGAVGTQQQLQGLAANCAGRCSIRAPDQGPERLHAHSRQRDPPQFPRLPNPDLVMYVYPHLAGTQAPVPGYSTVFPLYESQYALPGERLDDL
jgi:conjugative transfer region lipoprotein (TIGR03751 family)